MSTDIQRSFAGGEISKEIDNRADLVKYQNGLFREENVITEKFGSASNRPGTVYINGARKVVSSDLIHRFIPFVFSRTQSYVLEFGELYVRFITNGGLVTSASNSITGITAASPPVVTYSGADNYSNGDHIIITGVKGMVGVNNREFQVANVDVGANTFELVENVNTASPFTYVNAVTTGHPAYTSGGTIYKIYEIVSPYAEEDLAELKVAQSFDTMYIVHPSYAPRKLVRSGATSWAFSTITFGPDIQRPAGGTATGSAGAARYSYRVTAAAADGEESLPALGVQNNITAATQANPCAVTTTNDHKLATGDEIYISGVGGMTELNGRYYTVTRTGAKTMTLDGVDSLGYGAFTAGGNVYPTQLSTCDVVANNTTFPVTLNTNLSTGAVSYNIYRQYNGVYGLIASPTTPTTGTSITFTDDGSTVPVGSEDLESAPPLDRTLFAASGDYPSCITFYQNRLVFAGSTNAPQTVWASYIGHYLNFTINFPSLATEAVIFPVPGREANSIMNLLDVGKLAIFKANSEFVVFGDDAGILRPTAINCRQQSEHGSNTLVPLVVNGTSLFTQARGSTIRTFKFNFEDDGYNGSDLTVFSHHLFKNHTVSGWAYQQTPHSIVWAVRDDGALLGLTYNKEHEIWAWHQHNFKSTYYSNTVATVKSLCVVPEGDEDVLYLCVSYGAPESDTNLDPLYARPKILRLSSRIVEQTRDYNFTDMALSYNGWNTSTTTMTLTLAAGVYTMTASAAYFAADDVTLGNAIHLFAAQHPASPALAYGILRCTITAYTDTTHVTVTVDNVDLAARVLATATLQWGKAKTIFDGLYHLALEGGSSVGVSVYADGHVVASPHNADYTAVKVALGANGASGYKVTLSEAAVVVFIGMPITATIGTLPMERAPGTSIDRKKNPGRVWLSVHDTRGVFVGTDLPEGVENPFFEQLTVAGLPTAMDLTDGMSEVKYDIPAADDDDTITLFTGTRDVNVESTWDDDGRVFVRQVDPLPMTIRAIAPSGAVAGGR